MANNQSSSLLERAKSGYGSVAQTPTRLRPSPTKTVAQPTPSLIEQEDRDVKGGSRKAVLLAALEIGNRIEYVGYIELAMPLMMVAPRHRAFARAFSHSKRDIAWATWNQHSLRENLNLIVRVSRIVTISRTGMRS